MKKIKKGPIISSLSNGLKIIYLQTENDPISAGHIFLPHGTWSESDRELGITVLMLALLFKGTNRRTARELAEDTESLGAHVNASASHDNAYISCHSTAENFPKALSIMSEVLLQPTFPPEEVEKEKTGLLAAIKAKKEQISTVAGEIFNKNLYGKHPYGRPTSGNAETVSAIKREQIQKRHRKLIIPKGGIFSIATSHSFSEIKKVLDDLFGQKIWPLKPNHVLAFASKSPQLVNKHIKQPSHFTQAFLMKGFQASAARHPDFLKLKLLSGILGAGMSSRLFQSLRETRGLAYDVGAYYPTKKGGSSFVFYLGLEQNRIQEAMEGIEKEIKKIKTEIIPAQELLDAKNFIKGSYILDHQTNSQRSYYLGWWEILGLGPQFDKKFLDEISKITAKALLGVARKYLNNNAVTIEVHAKK